MTKRVFKWALKLEEVTTVMMPRGAQVIAAGAQKHEPGHVQIWAVVADRQDDLTPREFYVVGTGWKFAEPHAEYVGTAFADPYVWHVFEVTAPGATP